MPIFVAALIGALIQAAGSLVGRVLISLGIGYVVFSGVDASIGWAKTQVLAHLQGMPATALGVASGMKVGTCVSILTSALLARLTFQGMTSGTMKKMVQK
jgi:hypothetical protein